MLRRNMDRSAIAVVGRTFFTPATSRGNPTCSPVVRSGRWFLRLIWS